MQIALIMGRLKRSVKKTLLITQETSNKVENNDKIFRYFEKISELFYTCIKQKFYRRFDVIFEDYTNIMQIALIMGRLKRSEKKTLLMSQETPNKVENKEKILKIFFKCSKKLTSSFQHLVIIQLLNNTYMNVFMLYLKEFLEKLNNYYFWTSRKNKNRI